MAGIQGLRDSSNFVTDQRPQNYREAILLLYPNGKMPLTAITALMKSQVTDDPQFNWWEKELSDQRLVLNATIATNTTVLTFSTGCKQLKEGHLLQSEQTGEIVLVTADPASDTSVTVQRGFAETAAQAITATGAGINPNFRIIGTAHEEGSVSPTGINYDPAKATNYTQIFRNTLEITRTASKTRLRTGDQVKEAKRECLEYHGIELEKALWFGERKETVKNGKPIRTTRGVLPWIGSTYTKTFSGGTVSMDQFELECYEAFKFGSTEKLAILGNRALLCLQQTIRKNSSFQIFSGIKEFGMAVTRLTTPFGELVLKTHPLWNQMYDGTTGTASYFGMESTMVILDMEYIKYRYFQGDDTRYEPKLEDNGLDGMKSGYLTECGLEFHFPKAHRMQTGATA